MAYWNKIVIAVLALVIPPLTGCQQDKEKSSFFQLPREEQRMQFRKMTIMKQYDLYVYSMTKVRPNLLGYYDEEFVEVNGENSISFVVDKLEHENNSYRIVLALRLLSIMASSKKYFLGRRSDIILLAKKKINAMHGALSENDIIKGEKYLESIMGDTGGDSGQ